jgi:SNF2 family DNA or RNA helicase
MALIIQQAEGGLWAIRSTHYSKALRAACNTVPGMRFEGGVWVGYVDAVRTVRDMLQAQGLRLQGETLPDPGLPKDLTLGLLMPAYKDLRPYQAEGVQFVITRAETGVLLADDLGLGKSAQALRAARAFKEPTLIVCPRFARSVWYKPRKEDKDQIQQWWPDTWPPLVLEGVQPEKSPRLIAGLKSLGGASTVVCHYDILYAWAEHLAGRVRFVIFDEARYLQSEKSRRSIAARSIAEQAKWRVGLDGTPVSNHTSDLWNVLDTLSPKRWGKPFSFYLRYCNARQEQVTPTKVVWKFDGLSNEDELYNRLRYMMLQRTKSDVQMQLPPRIRDILDLEVEDQFCMGADVALRSDVSLRQALNLSADGKFSQIIEKCHGLLEEGRNIVVFTHRKKVCEAFADALGGDFTVGFIHGEVAHKKRDTIIASHPQALICNMDCVAGGIDLSYYDVDLFAELDYNPQKMIQCGGRLHRFGQKKTVHEFFCIGRGTIDELIRDRFIKKLDMFSKVVGKSDHKMKEDLDVSAREVGVADLRRFWEAEMGRSRT